ncbi:MAG TPA: Wzz/FepE/Etk N-terminal domain-containing protein [Candidatus Sulfotelmatobacter sp.]|nr:Wzz/FepE/Etk N-terminal domain-containing protein [Candidatus Sulfotelmatobacter sp.]
MIENRELTMDDYLAMLRRRALVIAIPALLAPLAGLLLSYAFTPKYTSQSLVLIEGQKVPESMVQPVVTEDMAARVETLRQQVLSQSDLQPMIERLGLAKSGRDVGQVMDEIRANMSVEPVVTNFAQIGTTGKRKPGPSPVPGFNVNYTAASALEAQQVCNELTSLLVTENLKSIQAAATGTSDVLNKNLEDAKHGLDDMDGRLAGFKKQYVGQLPGDEENNLKILMGLNSQLEANTQTLNRAQQDKSYTESMLAQQLSAWQSSQSSNNPETMEKQLSALQSQLLDLQARYTDDHPDVIKTKADIAALKKKLAEINKTPADAADTSSEKASATEPPEIRQLRLQIHQYSDLITAGTRDQKRLQDEIGMYQGRVSLSPAIEEQYKQLTRDYDNQQKNYQDLLAKKSTADQTIKMIDQSQGERMFPLNPANLPESPSFPNRWLFAGGGLGFGLALGVGLAMWQELRDKAIRTEADAEAALGLPMLVAVPWVGAAAQTNGNGRHGFWYRKKNTEQKEAVGT